MNKSVWWNNDNVDMQAGKILIFSMFITKNVFKTYKLHTRLVSSQKTISNKHSLVSYIYIFIIELTQI